MSHTQWPVASGQWVWVTGQEINVVKSMAFSVQHKAKGRTQSLAVAVELTEQQLSVHH